MVKSQSWCFRFPSSPDVDAELHLKSNGAHRCHSQIMIRSCRGLFSPAEIMIKPHFPQKIQKRNKFSRPKDPRVPRPQNSLRGGDLAAPEQRGIVSAAMGVATSVGVASGVKRGDVTMNLNHGIFGFVVYRWFWDIGGWATDDFEIIMNDCIYVFEIVLDDYWMILMDEV